jgi:hypothetical protein
MIKAYFWLLWLKLADFCFRFKKDEVKEKEKSNTEKSEKPILANNKFSIPTIEQIKEYCNDRKNTIDAEYFYNFYESKGWMVGKNKMKNWKSCVITWEKSNTNTIKQPTQQVRNTNTIAPTSGRERDLVFINGKWQYED